MHRSHSTQHRHKPGLTRREFLKFSGAAGLFAGLPILSQTSYTQFGLEAPVRVGLLLPTSTVHPMLSSNLTDGLALYFAAHNISIDLMPHHITPGRLAAEKATQALLEDGAQVVIGVLGETVIDHIAPLYAQGNVPMVVATTGENIIRDEYTHVSFSSLGQWQGAYSAGVWAAQTYGERAAIVASLYESGYDALYAFQMGFEAAGGQVAKTCITHNPAADLTVDQALTAVAKLNVDVIYAAYSGNDAQDFARAAATSVNGLPPLMTSPFVGDLTLDITTTSVSAWVQGYQPDFDAAFRQQTRRRADAFAWLGYATGEQAMRSFITPYAANMTQPLYRYETRVSGGQSSVIVSAAIDAPDEAAIRAAAIQSSVKTGWSTPYLVA